MTRLLTAAAVLRGIARAFTGPKHVITIEGIAVCRIASCGAVGITFDPPDNWHVLYSAP